MNRKHLPRLVKSHAQTIARFHAKSSAQVIVAEIARLHVKALVGTQEDATNVAIRVKAPVRNPALEDVWVRANLLNPLIQ